MVDPAKTPTTKGKSLSIFGSCARGEAKKELRSLSPRGDRRSENEPVAVHSAFENYLRDLLESELPRSEGRGLSSSPLPGEIRTRILTELLVHFDPL